MKHKQLLPFLIVLGCSCVLFFTDTIFDGLEMVVAAVVAIIASYLLFKKEVWNSLGFRTSSVTAKNLLLLAPLTGTVLFGLYLFVLKPLIAYATGTQLDLTDIEELRNDLPTLLSFLPLIWVSAAFGEEILFRGYFMRQFARIFGESQLSIFLNILLFGMFFGFLHSYQGITGQLLTGIIGMLISLIFYLKKYDLWFVVIIHGVFDTLALLAFHHHWM